MSNRIARPVWPPLLVAAFAALLSLAAGWDNILSMSFPDPDDSLRLVQVRDLLGGQAWFDVVQHRINPPAGGLMHWSRLIDLPIAAMIKLFTPLVGQSAAEMTAVLVYSATMLLLLFLLTARILRLYGDRMFVWAGMLTVLLIPIVMTQFRLARIDHHSAIMLLAFAAFGLTVARWRRWTGAAVAALLALACSISLETIIYMPAFGLVFAWPWLRRGEGGDQLGVYCLAFSLVSVAVMMVTRGFDAPLASYCDAMSRPYLAAVVMAALIFVIATRLRLPLWGRLAASGVAAAAALGALAWSDPSCLKGPFAALDPYVREHWYNKVAEGMPLWTQGVRAFSTIILHLITMPGLWLGWRASRNGPLRNRWAVTAFLYGWAMLVGCLVFRANGIGFLFGLPGLAYLALASWQKARAIPHLLVRVLATVGNPVLLAALVPPLVTQWVVNQENKAAANKAENIAPDSADSACLGPQDLAALNALPPSLLFSQINTGPQILLKTRHSVVATGHHRNNDAISKILHGFGGASKEARSYVAATPARYLTFCKANLEHKAYIDHVTDTLAYQLSIKRPPDWLEPVAMPEGATLQIYRILPAPAAPAPSGDAANQ